jgi:superfamily II DNA or RNA helicase
MDTDLPQLQTKSLRRAEDQEAYKIYRAALEWDLVDPILIKDRQDLKSEHKWCEHIEPYHHQVKNLIAFCRRLPVTLLADDVGLGKTISAGLVASELMSRGRISRILVVCPKLLLPQWKEELESKFSIPGVIAVGKDLVSAKPPEEGGAVITTYHSARIYMDAIEHAGFDMLVLDEAHKLRNLYGVDQAPQVAQRFRKVLADRLFKYVLMLTATPIQNRLWDIYSLVDLLTVARGHQNPFGSEGMFARTFIADNRTQARQLNPQMRDTFRSIVYGYMSRVRRADANLHFPERIVQLHRVEPTPEETQLISLIAEPIQKLNRLAQISILQALISSPHALNAQLKGMAARKTIPESLAADVQEVVNRIRLTAKLRGLGVLVDKLQAEQPERWRMVVFTTRRETQTTIEAFLEEHGVSCGLINGDSGKRNQETIAKFKKSVPDIHVIVSTEAGSEGVNLQAANVLVNYDLPWNPMIVEQRIGRIQRLASEHASVCVFNIILRGTFEEYVVGRLMEKLQMASHAIGDVEALLEASGMNDQDEDGSSSFEEKIRQLVVASLAGKNVEAATRMAEKSITDAKTELESQEKNIDVMLGGMEGASRGEIPFPRLPDAVKSMEANVFVLAALASLGTHMVPESSGAFVAERDGKLDRICFDDATANSLGAVLYRPGTAAFSRLASRIAAAALHRLKDVDDNPTAKSEAMGREWVKSFDGDFRASRIQEVQRSFTGTALVRVRTTVAHDSYERLIEISFSPNEHWSKIGLTGVGPISEPVEDPNSIGVDPVYLTEKARSDEGIAEFCRFYTNRRTQELEAAGSDPRKRKKIEDDFTPRLEIFLVGLEGTIHRQLKVRESYDLGSGPEYASLITIIPSANEIGDAPELRHCSQTGKIAPRDCLGRCEMTGAEVLKHLLVKSEVSGRMALPDQTVMCASTNKRALRDEVEQSAVTGQLVVSSILKTSALSGKRAEPQCFARCEFTGSEVLENELAVSRISGKRFRMDEQLQSTVSGKTGHRQEFVFCAETNQPLLPEEAERCEVTGKTVVPGLLARCEVSGKKVLPSELEKSAVTGKKALKKLFVSSSISGTRLLEEEAIRSATGKYCVPLEAKSCTWSGRRCHPDDLRTCQLTSIAAHFEYMTRDRGTCLEPLFNLLHGIRRRADRPELWPMIMASTSQILGGRSKIEAVESSPDNDHLAVCVETRNWLGLSARQAGLLYSIHDNALAGRIVLGKREAKGWRLEKTL